MVVAVVGRVYIFHKTQDYGSGRGNLPSQCEVSQRMWQWWWQCYLSLTMQDVCGNVAVAM